MLYNPALNNLHAPAIFGTVTIYKGYIILSTFCCNFCSTFCCRMSWVKIFGTGYSEGCVIITGLNYGQPTFGKISKVLLAIGNIIFQYKTLQVLGYSEHLNAYEVIPCDGVHFIKQDDLQDFHPLGIHQGFGNNANKLFVVLRYRVDCLQ